VTRSDHRNDPGSTPRPRTGSWSRRLCFALAGAASVAALAACGSSSSNTQQPPASASIPAGSGMSSMTPASSPATSSAAASSAGASQPAAQAAVITISKFAYAVPESVSPGAMITVVNKDEEAHTVTADSDGAFDDKATAGASTTFKAPSKPGSYPFHCTYHSNMHGVLVVK
jgi:plastocyanin